MGIELEGKYKQEDVEGWRAEAESGTGAEQPSETVLLKGGGGVGREERFACSCEYVRGLLVMGILAERRSFRSESRVHL